MYIVFNVMIMIRLTTYRSRVFLKLDNLQPSGSFKSRGIGNLLLRHLRNHPSPHFYSSSGGNAGLACVVAAAQLGHPATVVVPMTTKKMMMEKIEQSGARQVIQYGTSWCEADKYLREVILKNDPRGVYVPPFDHEEIWEGNSTIVEEILAQLYEAVKTTKKTNGFINGNGNGVTISNGVRPAHQIFPSAIVCSVGGGGLFCGVMRGLDRIDSITKTNLGARTDIIAIETHGASSLHQSLASKSLITLPGITSAATSLGCTKVAEQTFKYAQRPNVHSVSMSDADAEAGCVTLAETDRLVIELACGVNIAMCRKEYLEHALGREIYPHERIVIVVCGGSNVTIDMLAQWKVDVLKRQAEGIEDDIQVIHGSDY